MATQEQLNVLFEHLAALTQQMANQAASQVPPPPAPFQTQVHRRNIDLKHSRVPEFDGDQGKFDDWSFAFKRTMRAANHGAYSILARGEGMTVVDEQKPDDQENTLDVHAWRFTTACVSHAEAKP